MTGAVIFDLDDTLYPELTFVHAAFGTVATELGRMAGLEPAPLADEMIAIETEHGRGRVFDLVLERHDLPQAWVPTLLHTYRTSLPTLQLFDDAAPLLHALAEQDIPTGIVTDGCGLVQANKVRGLNVEPFVGAVVYTDLLGPSAPKPSTAGFEAVLAMLGAPAEGSIYIANDVRKDFIGPHKLGMSTMLVSRNILGNLDDQPAEAQPQHIVETLAQAHAHLLAPSV